jgi:hypothetical protein
MGIVVDSRISLKGVARGKPTVSSGRKAAGLNTYTASAQDTTGV